MIAGGQRVYMGTMGGGRGGREQQAGDNQSLRVGDGQSGSSGRHGGRSGLLWATHRQPQEPEHLTTSRVFCHSKCPTPDVRRSGGCWAALCAICSTLLCSACPLRTRLRRPRSQGQAPKQAAGRASKASRRQPRAIEDIGGHLWRRRRADGSRRGRLHEESIICGSTRPSFAAGSGSSCCRRRHMGFHKG